MMRKFKLFFPVVMMACIAMSCNKVENIGSSLQISASMDDCSLTRATLYNDATDLTGDIHVVCYSNDTHASLIDENATKASGASTWKTSGTYYFKTSQTLDAYAYYPADLSMTKAYTGLSFTHTVTDNSTAADQNDIMMGYSSASVSYDNMNVAVTLKHALTSVTFKYGDVPASGLTINKITISNVLSTGTCTFTGGATPTFSWTEKSGAVSVTGTTSVSPLKDANLGESATFALIPQSWTTGTNPAITIDYNNGTADKSYTYTLADNLSWERGKTYTFVINFNMVTMNVQCVDFNGGTWYSHDTTGTNTEDFTGETWE